MRMYLTKDIVNYTMKIYRHDANNSWILFDKIHIVIIHPHERYPNIIKWNKRFNRLKIGSWFEIQFGHIPDYALKIPLTSNEKFLYQKLEDLENKIYEVKGSSKRIAYDIN